MWAMAKDDPYFRLRVPEKLKAQIEKSAAASNRSMTAEIISRLEKSYESDELDIEGLFARVDELEAIISVHDEMLRPGRRDRG